MVATSPRELPLNAPKEGGYVAALDGLRGVAILLVLIYHFAWTFPEDAAFAAVLKKVFWTGWVGVDLFFALSGFLITQRLLVSRTLPLGPALRRFWARRFLRIGPPYYALLLGTSLVAWPLGRPLPDLSFWLYLQNYTIPFSSFEVVRWSSHLWSLAVEEQFYVLWPLFVLGCSPRLRVGGTLMLTLLGFAARAWFVMHGSPFEPAVTAHMAYTALPFRAEGLLLGALGAFAVHDRQASWARAWQRARPWILRGGSVALLAMAAFTRGFDQYDRRVAVIGYAMLAVVFASWVVAVAEGELRSRGWLTARPLIALGKVSYVVYLVHWPVVTLILLPLAGWQDALPPGTRMVVALGILPVGIVSMWAVGELSYRYFEAPLLRWKNKVS